MFGQASGMRRSPLPGPHHRRNWILSRTARARCKLRRVVIVQRFLGHFAKIWPPANPICGRGVRMHGAFHENSAKWPFDTSRSESCIKG